MSQPTQRGKNLIPTTDWSGVARAGQEDPRGPRPALDQLLRRYFTPLRAHLLARKQVRPDEVDDIVQSFVSSKLLESNLLSSADRAKGKFRTLLLTSLDRFAISHQRHAHASKRGADRTEALDAASDVADSAMGDTDHRADVFDVAWAREILRQTLERMRQQCEAEGRADVWGVFETRVLAPTLYGRPPAEYEDLVQKYSYRAPSQLWNAVRASKQLFARTMRAVIAEYVERDDQIDAELSDLREICSRIAQQDGGAIAYP
ncbi:MAG TPA: hypothetical protein VH518_18415 [Tepidisphaeraceae bacterium]|jgi:RNA polymerase sigma-70 factor (ECF subfamily)